MTNQHTCEICGQEFAVGTIVWGYHDGQPIAVDFACPDCGEERHRPFPWCDDVRPSWFIPGQFFRTAQEADRWAWWSTGRDPEPR